MRLAPHLSPRLPRTLSARLVAVAVLLVAVTAVLIGTATTLAMRSQLGQQLDEELQSSIGRGFDGPGRGQLPIQPPDQDGDDREFLGQRYGSVLAQVTEDGSGGGAVIAGGRGSDLRQDLDAEQLAALADVVGRKGAETVELPGLGTYRALAQERSDGVYDVLALPMSEVDETIEDLVRLELLATLLGVLAAAGVGLVVVRRQLAPLREVADTAHRVAELPLASGEIEMTERVPDRLTDERTEIGQVGAALNAMLDHVEASLDQRHRSEQQVRQFVADASHELRTPLATIAGYTELARSRPETTGTALDKVETESARMTGLVEDLLLLARLDSGRPLEREPVDLSRLLLEAVNDARVVDADHQWRLSLPDAPLTVTGDAARLHQVVTNLLTNARKYTPPGSTVTVTGTAAGFTVHDDGPGFPADLAPRAFERFTRGDAARTRAGGAGLGLSLVEAIVAAHGGTVDLVSAPSDTTITVTLPPT
ncbi:two-component system, OmpR family, sensor kinase [Nocardioides alpinus]|uniref:histidine kinase n=1 Tax=Nocardioides alpinus TaxID=748909 RepID=A0A1I0VVX6_9ACTN|nr:HAMP domain-containing sensor histidine kinase [Nocardioides alpinus]PKH37502.1 sensor histidine kinase [Nocardioides alpinus]SFA80207.1 two-component system, OmpR family, sensor kinase [Nocardioides alpinus]